MFDFLYPSFAAFLKLLAYGTIGGIIGLLSMVAVPLIAIIPVQLHRISFAPKDIPWVGQKDYTWFAKLRSTLVALKYERLNLEEGWEKVCGRPSGRIVRS